MRILPCLCCSLAMGLLASRPVPAQTTASNTPPTKVTTVDLIEDLRILALLDGFEPTRDQTKRLATAAEFASEELKKINSEARAKVEQLHEALAAARRRQLAGGDKESTIHNRVSQTSQSAESVRAQKVGTLIQTLTDRIRRILTPDQAARIEAELAPSADQPWRRYSQVLTGPGAASRNSTRMPSDPGKWLGELRDLRIDSAEGDPAHEVEDFGKKMTRGLKAGSPLAEQLAVQARAFATQVLAMPENVFRQREWELARMVSKQELDTRNQQRQLEGKPLEMFDAYRWLVEEMMLSPRAAAVLRERAALP